MNSLFYRLGAGALCLVSSSHLMAAGFGVRAQSASSLGTAGAADTAGSQDISAIYSNPASIGSFSGQRVAVGAALIKPSGKFQDGKRTYTILGTEVPQTESEETSLDDFGKDAVAPALFGTHQINDSVNVGWSFTAPFGTYSDYGKTWVGRYHGIKTELKVVNLDVGASYKLNEQVTLGFGVQIQQGSGSITGASNLGAGGAAKVLANIQAALAAQKAGNANALSTLSASELAITQKALAASQAAGAAATAGNKSAEEVAAAGAAAFTTSLLEQVGPSLVGADGKADVIADYQGKKYSAGFQFGVLYSPLTDLTLGLSYRSQVKHKTKGDISFSGDSLTAQDYIVDQAFEKSASLDIVLPDSISLGAQYKGIENLSLFANVTQTRWSSIDGLDVKYTSGKEGAKNILVKLGWKDVIYTGIGAAYKVTPELTLRTGLGVDKSPTVDSLRSPRSPDADRTLASLGAGYARDNWQVDLGIMHTQIKDPTLALKENDYPEAKTGLRGNLEGKYKVSANTVMLQYGQSI